MTLLEAIEARHSVRRYVPVALTDNEVQTLQRKIDECNAASGLHIQLVVGEERGFSGIFAYGAFSGVQNYIVMVGRKELRDMDERVGYYGEQIVLLAQQMGLGTCWAGLSYRKVKGVFSLERGETVACMIAVGRPDDDGRKLRRKSAADVSNAGPDTPEWFLRGVEAALRAPTAINQQKFRFEYMGIKNGAHTVHAKALFSLVGYTKMDLGIAKLHFEIGAGETRFVWG